MKMTKIQKIWLSLFSVMFLLPELLFSPIILSVLFLFGINFSPIMFSVIKEQFFLDHQFFSFLPVVIEILGIIGLFNFNSKLNKTKYKKLINTFLILIILFLSFILFLSLSLRHGIGF